MNRTEGNNAELQMKEAQRAIIQGYSQKLPMMIVKAVAEEFGEKGWAIMQKAAEQFGRERAHILQEALSIDVNDARSLGKIFDFEDSLGGVKGEWVESSPARAKKNETKCGARHVYKDYPLFCERILYWIARSTISELNPDMEIEDFCHGKLMARGDEMCEVVVKRK